MYILYLRRLFCRNFVFEKIVFWKIYVKVDDEDLVTLSIMHAKRQKN